MHTQPALVAELRGAGKSFAGRTALAGIDLAIHAGEMLAILGPNGAGKTTAIGLLTGRLNVDSGQASTFGADPLVADNRRRFGVMLQDTELPATLRAVELVRQFSAYYPQPRPVDETLTLAGITSFAHQAYGMLSGGQKRRVQFALAICGQPDLLFVDEPTVGLDVEARRSLWAELTAMRDAGTAIVLTTHYLEEADALADHIVMLTDGRVVASGSPAQIKAFASGKRLRFRSNLSTRELARWPEVEHLHADRDRIECRSRHAEALLRRLLAADPHLADIEVSALSLEDAVLSISAANTQEQAA